MAKIPCTAATLTFSGGVAEVRNVTITSQTQQIQGQAMENANPETFITGVGYTISGERYATVAASTPVFKGGATGTAVLTTQGGGVPATLFNGAVIISSAGVTQAQGALEMQQFTLTSNGTPTAATI